MSHMSNICAWRRDDEQHDVHITADWRCGHAKRSTYGTDGWADRRHVDEAGGSYQQDCLNANVRSPQPRVGNPAVQREHFLHEEQAYGGQERDEDPAHKPLEIAEGLGAAQGGVVEIQEEAVLLDVAHGNVCMHHTTHTPLVRTARLACLPIPRNNADFEHVHVSANSSTTKDKL